MKKYIEIVKTKHDMPVNRLDVTGQSERSICRLENGININLNHSGYYTRVIESETELKTGDLN